MTLNQSNLLVFLLSVFAGRTSVSAQSSNSDYFYEGFRCDNLQMDESPLYPNDVRSFVTPMKNRGTGSLQWGFDYNFLEFTNDPLPTCETFYSSIPTTSVKGFWIPLEFTPPNGDEEMYGMKIAGCLEQGVEQNIDVAVHLSVFGIEKSSSSTTNDNVTTTCGDLGTCIGSTDRNWDKTTWGVTLNRDEGFKTLRVNDYCKFATIEPSVVNTTTHNYWMLVELEGTDLNKPNEMFLEAIDIVETINNDDGDNDGSDDTDGDDDSSSSSSYSSFYPFSFHGNVFTMTMWFFGMFMNMIMMN